MDKRVRYLFDALLAAAVLVGLAVVLYGWLQLAEVPGWGRLIITAGLIVAGGAGAAFILPAAWRASLVIVGFAVIIAVFAANAMLYARVDDIDAERRAAAEAMGLPFDDRSISQVIDQLRGQGIDAYPDVSPSTVILDDLDAGTAEAATLLPLAGLSRVTTVACNETGRHLTLISDRYGFNNPDEVHDRRATVLVLGDSFAFGYCVQPEENVAGRLRERGFDVVNLGYAGSGPLIQLAQLREYGPLAAPRVVIWMFYSGNDITNLLDEWNHPALRRYLRPGYTQRLATRQDEIDAYLARYVEAARARSEDAERRRPRLLSMLALTPLRQRLGLTRHDYDHQSIEHFAEVVDLIVAETEALGAKLHFVYQPSYGSLQGAQWPFRERVLEVVESRDIPILDFERALWATGDPFAHYPFGLHGHFSAEGYRLLADLLVERHVVPADLVAGGH